ncbi:efflux RND transporter periplasmic adaptor subunit [Arcanobacterium ihumii]|uniref:hypothetical protein n=1 Tax=Arcanobacterium ihumii TaxID=2138162 RepID=UPI000F53DA4B|nr:hypothetical protein [Arcanobacterium ihumii]
MSTTSLTSKNPLKSNKKFTWIFFTVLIALIVISGAFLAGTFIHSANEEAIDNAKYTPELTAKVEKHTFPAEFVEGKGKVSLGASRPVVVNPGEGGQAVVTAVPRNVTANAMKALYKRVGAKLETPQAPSQGAESSAPALTAGGGEKEGNGVVTQESAPTPKLATTPLPTIRAAEFLSLTSGPATVVEIAGVNHHVTAEAPLARIRSGQAVAIARVSVAYIASFAVGTTVEINQTGSTQKTQANIIAMSDFRQAGQTAEDSVPGYDVTASIPAEAFQEGQSVTLTATSTKTLAEGIAVPITALREDAGKTYVVVKTDEGTKKVSVTTSRTAEGFALIDGDALKIGDVVVLAQ